MPAAQTPTTPSALVAMPTQLDANQNAAVTQQTTPTNNSAGQNTVAAATTQSNQNDIAAQLKSVGVTFSPDPNPLNVYANYTYHIRWYQTNEITAYNIGVKTVGSNLPSGGQPAPILSEYVIPTKATADALPKMIIAESGVTAGFNITCFEIKNSVGPGPGNLNTHALTWSMVVTEPFGFSLMDKIRSGSLAMNYLRCPYFIDVWFNGYDDKGNIVTNLFYKLYRVVLTSIKVRYTEAGAVYDIDGVCDGDVGLSDDIAIPSNQLSVRAKTVGEFFTNFQLRLNDQTKNVNEQPKARPNLTYSFVVPPDMQQWPLKQGNPDTQPQQNSDMRIPYDGVTMVIKIGGNGTSMENIINSVMSLSPNAFEWIKATGFGAQSSSDLNTAGHLTWPIMHPVMTITAYDPLTQDYVRNIQYNIVPFLTPNVVSDVDTTIKMKDSAVQIAKFNFLTSNNSLKREYDYYYTGLNTEIIKWDVDFQLLWNLDLPQFQANNNYGDFTPGPVYDGDAVGTQRKEGRYNPNPIVDTRAISTVNSNFDVGIINAIRAQKNLVTMSSSGQLVVDSASGAADAGNPELIQQVAAINKQIIAASKGVIYAEDVENTAFGLELIPIIMRQNPKPSAQLTDVHTDTNKAKVENSGITTMPGSRSFIGSILGNLFSVNPTPVHIELEIRGDPHWMGQGNIADDMIATKWAQMQSINIAKAGARKTLDDSCADFNGCGPAFFLNFRTGENYNPLTGLMQFDTTSSFWNGVYQVIEVHNHFRDGKFTQTLFSNRHLFQQALTVKNLGQGGIGHQ